MLKIVVKRKTDNYKEFSIRPSQSQITVGSEGDNDLIISDKNVSPYHLIIKKEANQYFIENINSESSTLLNGKKIVKKARIVNSDKIAIGEHSLIFQNVLFGDNRTVRENSDGLAEEAALNKYYLGKVSTIFNPDTGNNTTADLSLSETQLYQNSNLIVSKISCSNSFGI